MVLSHVLPKPLGGFLGVRGLEGHFAFLIFLHQLNLPSFPQNLLQNQVNPIKTRCSSFFNPETTTRMKLYTSLYYRCFYNNKGVALGLWLIWLCGIFLIGVSFYATQILSFSVMNQIKKPNIFGNRFNDAFDPTITIFTAVRPFEGSVGERQGIAVRSWLGLSPKVNVVLFSQDPSAVSFAGGFGSRVSVESHIDFTFLGTPFFHSMVARSQASASDISVLIDPQILLLPDFISTLRYARKLDHDWLLIASSQNISYLPFRWDADGKYRLSDEGKKLTNGKGLFAQKLQLEFCDRRMLLAWNNADIPLHNGVLPPFLYEKGIHYHWLLTEALSSDYRFIFDASWTISNTYMNDINHEYHRLIETSNGSDYENRYWEFMGNLHLGKLYGSFSFHEANYSNLYRFCKCDGHYHFVNTAQNIVYPLRDQRSFSLTYQGISGPTREKKILNCVDCMKSQEGSEKCSLKDQLQMSESISLPLSLELLLSLRADQNRTIVLAVAGYSYKDMLMSWVCRLRQLQISNFMVCAIDQEIYEFSVLQGLPVFEYENVQTNVSFDNCHFGTECFQKVTKIKSRMVLQILKLGYNVLMSDVDVYWFKNPLPWLSSFGPAILVAQSDEYNITGPINIPRRLNSGFYYVHSDSITTAALQKVVQHASTSKLSEQPSFYDTLCGEGGSYRLGDNRCLEPETNLTVHFLDRDLFPNGAYKNLWDGTNVKETCMKKGCFVLHNNWISGRRKKLERQVLSGLWEYDISTRMCLQNWHRNTMLGVGFWLLEMLKRWALRLGLVRFREKESRSNRELRLANISLDFSTQLKDTTVRIVHAGGREELYQHPIPASQLMQKYPGMCVARPDIFKRPQESVLSAEDYLLPGQKYYMVPSTTVQKLKRRFLEKGNVKQLEGNQQPILLIKDVADVDTERSDESFCSAKDFYVSNDRWSSYSLRRTYKEKKTFVPPIQKPKTWKELEWEPSLTSVQEVSP